MDCEMQKVKERISQANARKAEKATAADIAAFAAAEAEDPAETVTLEEYISQKEYSGKLMIRVPKELHRELAEAAKKNGVSLNQYAVYKLAK